MKTLAFASAAHEFRNPLNALVITLEMMRPYIQEERGKRYRQIAKNCSNLMLFLIKDIMDFSQLESNSLILNYTAVNIFSLLEECVSLLKFKADEKGIDLAISHHSTYWPPELFTDANRLKQIIINLLSNAIKYTMEGFVRIYPEIDIEN